MKKTLSVILISLLCIFLFAGCNEQIQPNVSDVNLENTENAVTDVKTVYPLPETLDINNLDDCTSAVSFEDGSVYVDDSGKTVIDMTVYTYDLYDMVDIATLAENDIIVRLGEEVKVTAVERLDTGLVRINGGEENGGFDLISSNSTVYYEIGMSDIKNYYKLGEVTLPVSDEFVYTDESNLDAEPVEYFAGDFLTEGVEYNFNPNNTSIVIQDGNIVAMKKVYTP